MRAIVFSGHLADAPDRTVPRLPAGRIDAVGARIAAALVHLQAGPGDLALTQGAAGSDLLFAEHVLDRGLRLRLLLPSPRDAFVARSVRPVVDGERWCARFAAVARRLAPGDVVEADDVLGPLDPRAAPDAAFVRCNAWLLDAAEAAAPERLLLCVWDGRPGGAGGTGDMAAAAARRGFATTRIDPGVR